MVWLQNKFSGNFKDILICWEIKNQAFKKMDHPLLDLPLSPILVKRTQTPATQEYTRQEAAQWKGRVEKYHIFVDEMLIILWQKLFPINTVK